MSPVTLAAQQGALLQALWQPDLPPTAVGLNLGLSPGPLRGLEAYRTNARSLAQRALLAAYPVLQQLIGDDNFAPLARLAWQTQPPTAGDVDAWGVVLPAVIANCPQLADLPYLGDVARVEWALHSAARQADAELQPASFALLSQHPGEALSLQLAPGTQVIASPWPVVSLIQAHASANITGSEPDFTALADLLSQRVAQTARVWRQGWQVRLQTSPTPEAALLQTVLTGQSLHHGLQAALAADPAWDFGGWLREAVQQGLLLGIRPLPTTTLTGTPGTPTEPGA